MIRLLAFFARFYTFGKFIKFLKTAGKKAHFLPILLTIFYCMQDEDTPRFIKLILMGAIGYVILPFDFIPNLVKGADRLDDNAVLSAALRLAGTYVKPEHWEKTHSIIPFSHRE